MLLIRFGLSATAAADFRIGTITWPIAPFKKCYCDTDKQIDWLQGKEVKSRQGHW